jgi:hypothetical protein
MFVPAKPFQSCLINTSLLGSFKSYEKSELCLSAVTRAQCYKTFYSRDLEVSVPS